MSGITPSSGTMKFFSTSSANLIESSSDSIRKISISPSVNPASRPMAAFSEMLGL